MKITPIFPIVVLSIAPIAPPSIAQLIPDNTLGPESSVVTPVGQTGDRIEGGAARGSNLFHSFSEFNVDAGRSVYFANPAAIQNILTRVTGSNPSNIMGRLGVLGDANLFLLNPNGIVFGPEASLDIRGSFYGTTGEGIKLGENGLFSATDLDPSNLLEVQPSALFQNALANHMAELNNQANLAVPTGSELVLHGGEVRNSGSLTAPGGTVMVLGEKVGLFDNASIDVSEARVGGEVLVTGARTYVGPDVTIKADAISTGNGGNVIVWGDEITGFYGNISARGGIDGGNGGFVEVSAGEILRFRGEVDTTAALGQAGTLLLDPRNIIIANGSPQMEISDAESIADDIFNGGVDDTEDVTIYESQLEGLSGDTNVILQGTNDIVVEDLADEELSFAPGTGEITLTADADGDGVGSFVMEDVDSDGSFDIDDFLFANGADTIRTNGRDITISGATLTIGNIDTRGRDTSVAPPDNAGQSIATAQVISSEPGVALETISGNISTRDDVDMFGIYLSGSGTFSAVLDRNNQDLSLFDADGRGIYKSLGFTLIAESPFTPAEPGLYYLAVGHFNQEPVSERGAIFPNRSQFSRPRPQVVGAHLPGGELPLSNWQGSGTGLGIYTITLTGTQAAESIFVESIPAAAISQNGGSIALEATNGDIEAASLASGSTSQWGEAGSGSAITLDASDNISIEHVFSGTRAIGNPAGNGGAIALKAGGDITTRSLDSDSRSGEGAGNGGEISLTAGGNIMTGGQGSSSIAEKGTAGNGGKISLTAGGDITIAGSATIWSVSISREETAGNGGAISLTAGGNITTNNLQSNVISSQGTAGNGGAIDFTAGGNITTGGISSSSTIDVGTAGDGGAITLTAEGDIDIPSIDSDSESEIEGMAGDGGAISLTAGGDIAIDQLLRSYSRSDRGTAGRGGAITIEASGGIGVGSSSDVGDIFILEGVGGVPVDSTGDSGGNITLASPQVSLNNVLMNSNANGSGNSGNILIAGDRVDLKNTELNTALRGKGGAGGSIRITASEAVKLELSRLFAGVEEEAIGDGGQIEITAVLVELSKGSLIDTATFNQGNAGDVRIESMEMDFSSSGIFSITAGEGNAGKVTVEIAETLSLRSGSSISTAVNRTGIGDSGDISISAGAMSITGGSQLQALTRGQGASGEIRIDVREDIEFSGIGGDGLVSGVFTSTEGPNSLRGGDINVTARNVLLEDGAVLSGESNSPSVGGNINVTANRIEFLNGGQILTNSFRGGSAGDITVNVTEEVVVRGVDPNFNQRPAVRRQEVRLGPPRTLREEEVPQLLNEELSLDSIDNRNRNVESSSRIPYVSIEGTGDGTVDVYSFEVRAGTRGILDIDNGDSTRELPSDVNTRISLFNPRGEKLTSNTLAPANSGGEGSVSPWDAYLRYAFGEPGIYSIEVGKFLENTDDSVIISEGIPSGGTYTLQVSLETPNVGGSIVEATPSSGMFARTSGAGAAGNIRINAPSLTVSDGANISATATQTATTSEPGGSITINASQLDLSRTANSGSIEAQTLSRSPAGEISIQPLGNDETLRVNLTDGFEISASTIGEGAGGNLEITAPEEVMVTGDGTLSAQTSGAGAAGNITISAPSLNISEQVRISAAATSEATATAPGGSITVNAEEINLSGNSSLEAQTVGRASAGSITLKPFNDGGNLGVSLDSGTSIATISASTAGSGAGGNLNVEAPNSVLLRGDGTLSVETSGAGPAGNVTISTPTLNLSEKVRVTATATSEATTTEAGGSITVNANNINLSGTSALEAQTAGVAPAGSVTLRPFDEGGSLAVSLESGTSISASTTGSGAGGNLNVEAPDSSVTLIGKGSLSVESLASGRGGNATITTDSLRLREGATVSASSTGMGEAGSVNVVADFIELNNGFVEAETAAGARGNINISTSDLRLFNNSAITTNATGTATGGNITISTDNMVLKAGTSISANAVEGAGGNIQITAQGVFAENDNQITATSDRGIDGIVEINNEVDPASGLVQLDNNPLDAEKILAQNFCVLAKENDSSFIITGRGGIAINPGDYLTGEGIRVGLVDPVIGENSSTSSGSTSLTDRSRSPENTDNNMTDNEIRQAQGWVQLPDGTIVLTSYPVISTPHGPLLQHPDCN